MGAGCLIKSLSNEWLQWQSVVLRSAHTQRKAAGNNQGEKPVQDATGPKPVVDKIDVGPGDHWTYQAIDDITDRTKFAADYAVTEIRGKTGSVQSAFTRYGQNITDTSLEVFDEDWDLLQDPVWTRKPGEPSTGIRLHEGCRV
jgi:hypothetical protein